jgi:hypothetical protein
LDLGKIKPLTIDAYETPTIADLAPVIDGKPDITKLTSIDVEKLGREQRMQRVIFQSSAEVYDMMKPNWKANREFLLAQIIRITEEYLTSGRVGNPLGEASACLEIANANGGIPKMRETIMISGPQLQQLQNYCDFCPEERVRIERAIQFREQVLEFFDLLTSGTERTIEEIMAKPVSDDDRTTIENMFADFGRGR